MKKPADLALRWAQQWQNPDLREARLLGESTWPASLAIGRPTPTEVASSWNETASIIRLWRESPIGSVHWKSVVYRATGTSIEIPLLWEIASNDEWIVAANDRTVRSEYNLLCRILSNSNPLFHTAFVRERSLWRNTDPDEVIRASHLVLELMPGCALGKPLRSLSLSGIDSKFFERNRTLITRLLDIRFDGEASHQGLETFLNAWRESDHWLLLVDLGGSDILPFPQMRVRASDLVASNFKPRAVLIVENERCLHLLPQNLSGVIAVLGTGNNLAWLRSQWIQDISVAYWGDLDTWGLTLLARARSYAPGLMPLLMTREIFDHGSESTVVEKISASVVPPAHLTATETLLYQHLLASDRGRLEQEFLPASLVHSVVNGWVLASH